MLSPKVLSNLMEAEGMHIEIEVADLARLKAEDVRFEARMFDGNRVIHGCPGASPLDALAALLDSSPYPAEQLAYWVAEVGMKAELEAYLEEAWADEPGIK